MCKYFNIMFRIKCMPYVLILIIISYIELSQQARILGAIPTPSYSHQIVFKQLWKALALRGHDVTVITTNPSNDKSITNLKEIDISFAYDIWEEHNIAKMIKDSSGNGIEFVKQIMSITHDIMDKELAHPVVQKLIKNESEHFDLVMIEYLQPAMYAFKHRFNCSFIGVTSFDANPLGHAAVGNPNHPVANPNNLLPFSGDLTFFERLVSVLFINFMDIYGTYYGAPPEDETVRKHFGEGYPSVLKLGEEIDMLFINVHPVLHGVRPTVPATVMIGGGIHLEPPKPLPKDLKKYLDESKTGVIYFSLGSNAKSKDLSPNTKSLIMEAFSELPYNVLWKYEVDDLPGKPDNVKLVKWAPQQDILRHPNVLVFISQCGLQSTDEALFNNVPVLAMPMFADQDNNAKLIERKGFGININHASMTKSEFKESIIQLIINPIYKNTVSQLSRLALDEPMTGLEKAVWWTEYVLRNKGNLQHLKSRTVNMPAYQYYLLDVIGFCLLVVVMLLFCTVKLFKLLKFICFNIIKKKEKTN